MQYDQSTLFAASQGRLIGGENRQEPQNRQEPRNRQEPLERPGQNAPTGGPPLCLTGVSGIGDEEGGRVLHAGADTVYVQVPITEHGLLRLRQRLDEGWLPPGCLGQSRGMIGYDRRLILEDGLRLLVAPETNLPMGLYVMCGPVFLLTYPPDQWAPRLRMWLARLAGGGDGGWWRDVDLRLSRADECVDVCYRGLPNLDRGFLVSDAKHRVPAYYDTDRWTGLQYGRGDVVVRVYDKAYEAQKDKDLALWQTVWGGEPSEGEVVLRYEAQLRADRLRELGLRTLEDYAARVGQVWRYAFDADEGWWRVAYPIGPDHEGRRQPFVWYEVTVGRGLAAFGGAVRLLTRQIRLNLDPHQLALQIRGTFLSLRVAVGQMAGLGRPASAFVARRWLGRLSGDDDEEAQTKLDTRWRRATLAAIP